VLLTAVLSVPILYIKYTSPVLSPVFQFGYALLLSLGALVVFYWSAQHARSESAWRTSIRFVPEFFLFLSISMGLSLHNSIAVLEGYIGRKTPFIRTPKYNLVAASDTWRKRGYRLKGLSFVTVLEGLLALYFIYAIVLGLRWGLYGQLPLHVLLAFGFGTVFFYSLFHSRRG